MYVDGAFMDKLKIYYNHPESNYWLSMCNGYIVVVNDLSGESGCCVWVVFAWVGPGGGFAVKPCNKSFRQQRGSLERWKWTFNYPLTRGEKGWANFTYTWLYSVGRWTLSLISHLKFGSDSMYWAMVWCGTPNTRSMTWITPFTVPMSFKDTNLAHVKYS